MSNTTLVFDPYSGASGDMVLGALVDLGVSVAELEVHVRAVLPTGWRLAVERVAQNSVHGIQVRVEVEPNQPQRDWGAIRALIDASSLPQSMKSRAIAIFQLVADAEARVHNTPLDHVHFHEVGAVDSIVDIVGAAVGFELLGIERAWSNPVRTGHGFVLTSHGLLPVPAPATAEIVASCRLAVLSQNPSLDVAHELLTPTGAAILGALGTEAPGTFRPTRVGMGFGTWRLPWPNALRVYLCE